MVNCKIDSGLIPSALPRYSGLITVASVASIISSFVDGCIFGSTLGSNAMAAFGIATPFVLILVVASGMILSSGGSICASKAIGAGDQAKANSNFTACLMMGTVIGAVALVICFVLPDPLIEMTGAEVELAKEAVAYLKGYSFGTIPTIYLTILMYYANLDGNESLSILAVCVMTVVDIALDLLLGVRLSMGLFGMALATSISYVSAVVIFLVFFLIGKSSFSIRFKNIGTEVKDILKTGFPSALNSLLVSCRCFFLNLILLGFAGIEAVSAFSFQSNFNQFFIAIATGVSTAVSVLAGIYIGEKDRKGIRTSVNCGFQYGILFSAILALLLFIAAPVLAALLLISSDHGLHYATMALRLYSLSMPVYIVNVILISFYQTTGDRKAANLIAIGHGLILPLGCAYIFSALFGLNGVWISSLIAECLMIGILALILKGKTKKMPKKLEDFAYIESSAFPVETDIFEYCAEVNALVEDDVRERIGKFLMDRKYDEKQLEQMEKALSVILSAGNNQKGFVDIQGAFNGTALIFHVRFNGRDVDKLLNSSEWHNENISLPKVSSHYSAGISFVRICMD